MFCPFPLDPVVFCFGSTFLKTGTTLTFTSILNNHVRINDHSSRKDVTVAQPSIRYVMTVYSSFEGCRRYECGALGARFSTRRRRRVLSREMILVWQQAGAFDHESRVAGRLADRRDAPISYSVMKLRDGRSEGDHFALDNTGYESATVHPVGSCFESHSGNLYLESLQLQLFLSTLPCESLRNQLGGWLLSCWRCLVRHQTCHRMDKAPCQ
jgi:hypothetical protein